MSWIEVGIGAYVIIIIALGLILDSSRGIPFPLTYSWGAATAFIAQVFLEAIKGSGRINLSSVVMAILVTSFAVYITAKKKL